MSALGQKPTSCRTNGLSAKCQLADFTGPAGFVRLVPLTDIADEVTRGLHYAVRPSALRPGK